MAQLKDLIVNGPSRFIGDVYATTFTGNLAGNANTATSATTAAALTGKTLVTASAVTTSNYPTYVSNHIPTMSFMAYWNGAYSGTSSNLTYCKQGTIIGSSNIGSQSVNYATSSGSCSGNAATATKARYLQADNDAASPRGALLRSGSGRADTSPSGDTWIFWDELGGTSSYWGIRHNQANNSIGFCGAGSEVSNINLETGKITSKGFILTGSSSSYVLLGNGGHAAISGLSVNYANSSGACTGNAATATNASSAGNADKLDGVHYQNILERYYSGYSSSGTATGWFRIAETLITDDGGATFLLAIQRGYSYTNNESYLFSISVSFGGGISITQLSGYANTRLITKIRVDWAHSQIAYVDLYIGSSSKTNDYFWYTVGCAKSYTTWTANPTLMGQAHEFTTVQGCKSDKGFTGYLTGTASSASKWVYARTITLTGSVTGSVSIDGSGDVSLATTTNHTHTFASLTSKPTTISGYGITDAYTKTQTDTKLSGYLSLSGGTMTGTIIVDSYTAFGPTGGNFYLGTPKYPLLLRSSGTTTINGNTLIHSGNYNSYAPKLDGTGAKGTWGINISGKAATATKLANSRTIWGHNFDGTGNVKGALSGVTTINSTLYFDSSGNVGIGTASPSYKLHVNGDGYFTDNVITESDFSSRGNAIIDGYVGIGTISPSYKLHVVGDGYFSGSLTASGHTKVTSLKASNICIECDNSGNTAGHTSEINNYSRPLYIQYSTSNNCCICYGGGNVGIGITSPTYKLHVSGDARIDGTISCIKLSQTSDIKYKTNIKQIEYEEALKIIENLNPVTWDWNENTVETGSSSGFVAQEAEEFIPNAISRDNENNLSLDYTQLHSYEIRVIQEQQKEIIKLKEKLKILEKLIS